MMAFWCNGFLHPASLVLGSDRIVAHIFACEGDFKWAFFDGNYQEYEANKKKRPGEWGAKPERIRYKPISGANGLFGPNQSSFCGAQKIVIPSAGMGVAKCIALPGAPLAVICGNINRP